MKLLFIMLSMILFLNILENANPAVASSIKKSEHQGKEQIEKVFASLLLKLRTSRRLQVKQLLRQETNEPQTNIMRQEQVGYTMEPLGDSNEAQESTEAFYNIDVAEISPEDTANISMEEIIEGSASPEVQLEEFIDGVFETSSATDDEIFDESVFPSPEYSMDFLEGTSLRFIDDSENYKTSVGWSPEPEYSLDTVESSMPDISLSASEEPYDSKMISNSLQPTSETDSNTEESDELANFDSMFDSLVALPEPSPEVYTSKIDNSPEASSLPHSAII